jgi:hypothetical protein
MAGDGLSAYLADKWLAMLAGTAYTAPAATYVQLHTGDPGASGTSNVSSVTTREAVTWGTSSAGSVAESNTPTWSTWAGTNGEIVTDISVWDASTSGNFLFSASLAGTAYEFTCPTASPGVFTAPGSAYSNGTEVVLTPIAGLALPTGFTGDALYFIVSASGATFELSLTSGGSAVNATGAGGGLVQASGAKTMDTGDTLEITSLSVTFTPVAA